MIYKYNLHCTRYLRACNIFACATKILSSQKGKVRLFRRVGKGVGVGGGGGRGENGKLVPLTLTPSFTLTPFQELVSTLLTFFAVIIKDGDQDIMNLCFPQNTPELQATSYMEAHLHINHTSIELSSMSTSKGSSLNILNLHKN